MQIIATNLMKKFGSKLAVKDVSLKIIPGQILGLLGPNGAGKSTTIKILSGQINAASGNIQIDDQKYLQIPDSLRSKIGVMPQEIILWDKLTVMENLKFTAQIQGMSKQDTDLQIQNLVSGLNLEKEINTLAEHLSGGYKRRLNLAISIIHNPSLVFLDEPSPGIDPQSRRFLWDFIYQLKKQNKAVVLTDHYLEEAEKLCDYVVIIDEGKVIAEGTVPQLKLKYGAGTLLQVNSDNLNSEKIIALTTTFPEVKFSTKGFSVLADDTVEIFEKLIPQLKNLDIHTNQMELRQPSLEDIFLILTGKEIRE
jgi:ABC-2 type transport system ATP-binding protein